MLKICGLHNMGQVLLISLIGMGLVFAAILLVWLLMALLVRFTGERPKRVDPEGVEISPVIDPVNTDRKKIAAAAVAAAILQKKDSRKQAAAAAVAVLLAQQKISVEKKKHDVPVSSWQPVLRSIQREERMRLFGRKPRGRME